MKKLILFTLLFITFNINAQTTSPVFKKPEKEYLFAMNSPKLKYNGFNTKIDFKYKEQNDVKTGGLAMILAGIAFTTASLLESGDGKISQGETARQIMLGTGVVLTITGIGISINNK